MEITRNVILDLLPLYMADEVSTDTRSVVDNYLQTDPELAEIVKKQSTKVGSAGDMPSTLTNEVKLKSFRKTKWMLFIYIVVLAALLTCIVLGLLAAFFISA